MTRIWFLVHFIGFVAWLGGGFAAMVVSLAARDAQRSALGSIAAAQAALHKRLLAPGALLVVVSGLVLTVRFMGAMTTAMSPWLMAMQGAGLLGALITLLVGLPTASRLARIDPEGQHAAYFDELRARLRIGGMVSGVLALFALIAGVFYRTGG
jgi:hypothetical protein